jgi:hypothetical protein
MNTPEQRQISYEEIVEFLAKEKVNQRISNGRTEHAISLLKVMFKYAEKEIRIYTGCLFDGVYGDKGLLSAFKNFLLDENNKVFVLLQNNVLNIDEHPMIQTANDLKKINSRGRFIVRHARGIYAQESVEHFAVMDKSGFRYELDDENKKAIANFNEPKTASNFIKAFDLAFELAEKPVYQL